MLRLISQMQATLGCVRQYKKAPAEVYSFCRSFYVQTRRFILPYCFHACRFRLFLHTSQSDTSNDVLGQSEVNDEQRQHCQGQAQIDSAILSLINIAP